MKIRAGSPTDAEAVATLIASFQNELTDDPSGVGAEGYLASVSAQPEREYLTSPRYHYLLAVTGSVLLGFIAIRDRSHNFHLFVARSHHRQGLGRQLWEQALHEFCVPNSEGVFTVNASLLAVPAYQAFGFAPAGPKQLVHGISFLPMRRSASLP